MSDAGAIAKLRAIAARLDDCGDPHAQWFIACLAEYTAGAVHGLRLDHAFGFRLGAGETPWWEQEAQARRDELIRTIAGRYFLRLSVRGAAEAIAKKAARYQAGEWRHHRRFTVQPALRGLRADLFRLLKTGAPVSVATARRALAQEMGVFVSHASRQDPPPDLEETA